MGKSFTKISPIISDYKKKEIYFFLEMVIIQKSGQAL